MRSVVVTPSLPVRSCWIFALSSGVSTRVRRNPYFTLSPTGAACHIDSVPSTLFERSLVLSSSSAVGSRVRATLLLSRAVTSCTSQVERRNRDWTAPSPEMPRLTWEVFVRSSKPGKNDSSLVKRGEPLLARMEIWNSFLVSRWLSRFPGLRLSKRPRTARPPSESLSENFQPDSVVEDRVCCRLTARPTLKRSIPMLVELRTNSGPCTRLQSEALVQLLVVRAML